MRSGYTLEQLFLRLRGGQLEVALVLLAPSGATKHETVSFPTRSELEAVQRAGAFLAGRPDIEPDASAVEGVRLRVERQGSLRDDTNLKRYLTDAFLDALA